MQTRGPCCRLTFCHDGNQSLIFFFLPCLFLFFPLLLLSIFFLFWNPLSYPTLHTIPLPSYLSSFCPVVFHCEPTEGLLPESHRDSAQLCSGMEQPGVCVQRTGRDMAGHTPFWKGPFYIATCVIFVVCLFLILINIRLFSLSGSDSGSQFPWCIHQLGKCLKRSTYFWQVCSRMACPS